MTNTLQYRFQNVTEMNKDNSYDLKTRSHFLIIYYSNGEMYNANTCGAHNTTMIGIVKGLIAYS